MFVKSSTFVLSVSICRASLLKPFGHTLRITNMGGGGGIRDNKCLFWVCSCITFAVFFSSVVFCSQMTDLVNVTKYHNKGYKGKGIKCA
ncbi:hypothetical protein, partial [Candidatus Endomicrobiellum cubanum]|uniref:hypothetical protein n=1 Tax=Candidatus Endomicrobiellum cubanum TaxID=3242325 RepID=UPI003593F60C